jgi:vacuolar protein sorting-associated protein 13B
VKSIHKKMNLSLAEGLTGEEAGGGGGPARFLTELDIQIQPLDLVLSTRLLHTLAAFVAPLSAASRPPAASRLNTNCRSGYELMSGLNNNTLPLVYLKADRFRLFLAHQRLPPGTATGSDEAFQQPDFVLFQVGETRLTCQADNPLSRILVNDAIFYAAAEAGQLEVPGSGVEDRQYQLDLVRIGLYTGVWRVSCVHVFYCFVTTSVVEPEP